MTIYVPNQDLANSGWSGQAGGAPAIITSKQAWRSQPQYPVEVDWSNPAAKDLCIAWLPQFPYKNLVGGNATYTSSGFTDGVNVYGKQKATSGSGTGKVEFNVTEKDEATFVILGELKATGNQQLDRLFSGYNGASNGRFDIYYVNENGVLGLQILRTSANTQYTLNNVQSGYALWAFRYSGTYADAYKNGVLLTSSETHAGSGSLVTASTKTSFFGRPDVTTRQPAMSAAMLLKFDRIVGRTELLDLANNPFSLFKPAKRLIMVGGTTPVTSNLYTTLDESTTDDNDFISTDSAGSVIDIALPVTALSDINTLKYRAASPEADLGLKIELFQGGAAPTIITSKQPWRMQPQGPVGIDWSNPLTRGLFVCFKGASPIELVNMVRFVRNNNPFTTFNISGECISSTNNGASYDGFRSPENTSGSRSSKLYDPVSFPISLMIVGNGKPSTTSSAMLSRTNGSGVASFSLGFRDGATKGVYITARTTSGSIAVAGTSAVDTTNGMNVGIGVIGNTTTTTFVNGRKADEASTPSGNIYYEYNDIYRCLCVSGNYSYAGGNLAMSAGWRREITDQEVKSISDNPWQIFRPAKRLIMVGGDKLIASHTKTYTELTTTVGDQSLVLTPEQEASVTASSNFFVRLTST